MGGKGKELEDAKDWPKVNEDAYIRLLIKNVREGKLLSSTFKKEVWLEINDELRDITAVDYGIKRLKGKFNRLRAKYREFSELIGHTRVKWDVTTNVVNASYEIWEDFFKKSKNFKKFKKHGCADYDLLGEIFNTTSSTKKLQQLSTEDLFSDTQERHLEEEFLSSSMHVDLDAENSEIEGDERGKKRSVDSSEHQHCKMDKMEKMDSFSDKCVAATLSAKDEAYKAKVRKYRSSSTSGSALLDPFSISVCMDLLEKMEGVSSASYNKVIKKFLSADWRQIFVGMSDRRRRDWVNSLA